MNYLHKGLTAEEYVVNFLIQKQFSIIGKNIKNKFGEIDILCQKNNKIYIVEVKYRNDANILLHSIDKTKIHNCLNAFYEYFQNFRHNYDDIKLIGAFVDRYKKIHLYYLEE